MANFNKVLLMGNLTRDCELRYTPRGTPIYTNGLAVNRTWKDEAGDRHEETTFVDVTGFGKQAETLQKYTRKGHLLFVEGRLRQESWEDKQSGQKRYKLTVVIENFQLMPKSGSQGGSATASSATASDAPPAEDDDVPF